MSPDTQVVLNLTDGQWTATAAGDTRRSATRRGAPVPTTDVLTVTPEVVDGVATIRGTLRTSATPWGCPAPVEV